MSDKNQIPIIGAWLSQPNIYPDERGLFTESFKKPLAFESTGYDFQTLQVNTSVSRFGTLRGLHFQDAPPGQAKFVFVPKGRILDVLVDLRPNSPSFREINTFELSEDNRFGLLVPPGVGHGFLALDEETCVTYLCDNLYIPDKEISINMLTVGLDFEPIFQSHGISRPILSEKDATAQSLSDYLRILEG